MKSWVKLEMQCLDLSGTVLWEETASNGTSLSGKGALKSALKKMQERLAARIGQPGLEVQGGENASATQSAAGNAPGQIQLSVTAQDATVELPEGTLVRLMLIVPVNSKTASVGDKVEFRVLEDVRAGNLVVIPRKALASGVVTEVIPPRRRSRPGRSLSRPKRFRSLTTKRSPCAACGRSSPATRMYRWKRRPK